MGYTLPLPQISTQNKELVIATSKQKYTKIIPAQSLDAYQGKIDQQNRSPYIPLNPHSQKQADSWRQSKREHYPQYKNYNQWKDIPDKKHTKPMNQEEKEHSNEEKQPLKRGEIFPHK